MELGRNRTYLKWKTINILILKIKIYHAHEGVLFFLVDDLKNLSGYDVEALTVADWFVVSSERQQDSFEERAVLLIVLAAKGTAACTMQVLYNLNAQLVVVRIRQIVKSNPPHFVPIQVYVHDILFWQVQPNLQYNIINCQFCFGQLFIKLRLTLLRNSCGTPPGRRASAFMASFHCVKPPSPGNGFMVNFIWVSTPNQINIYSNYI